MLLQDLQAVPAGALDADHLKAVIAGLESALQEQRLQLDPDKKGELVLALYELTRDSGTQPQRATILRLVRSAA